MNVFDRGAELYLRAALVGDRVYLRGETALACVDLTAQ